MIQPMDNKTIRYKNTRYLVDLTGGVSSFAEKLGKGQSQTSQFAGSTPIKGIGNKIAREIEAAFKKEHGWLDVAHPELWGEPVVDDQGDREGLIAPDDMQLLELIERLRRMSADNKLTAKDLTYLDHFLDTVAKAK